VNYLQIFAFFAGLILLNILFFPRSKLFFVPPIIFSFQAFQEDLHFLPMLSASSLIIFGYFKKEDGLTPLKILFALLPVIPFLLNSDGGYAPVFPFPGLLKNLSAPFPIFLSILINLVRGDLFLKIFSLSIFLTFLFPSLKILFNAILFILTMKGIHLLEEEIVRGEGKFFSNFMRWIWIGIKVSFFILIFFCIFSPDKEFTCDILYIFLSFLSFEIGFLLKSATILIRHKIYFSAIGFLISTILYFSFV